MRLLTLIAAMGLLIPCREPELKINAQAKPTNSQVIGQRCAIIVRPDAKKIALLKKNNSTDEYDSVVNDNEYYMGTSIAFLDSVKVKQIEKISKGELIFKGSSGKYFKVSLNSFSWGILLFNGRTKPIEADATDITRDYQTYMKR